MTFLKKVLIVTIGPPDGAMKVGVVTLFGTRLSELPGLILNEALPVGVGVGAYSLTRIWAYRWLRGQGWFRVDPAIMQVATDGVLVVAGLVMMNASLGSWLGRAALGWFGYGTLGLIQTILIRTTGWDPLATITMGNPHAFIQETA